MKTGCGVFSYMLAFLCLVGCKAQGDATLVDPTGRFYYGEVLFSPEYHTGDIQFLDTPYGPLTGPFTVILTENDPIIELKNLPMKKFNGKAHLGNKGKRFLECDITTEFRTKGMGDLKMIGCGTCYDKDSLEYDIVFQ